MKMKGLFYMGKYMEDFKLQIWEVVKDRVTFLVVFSKLLCSHCLY